MTSIKNKLEKNIEREERKDVNGQENRELQFFVDTIWVLNTGRYEEGGDEEL